MSADLSAPLNVSLSSDAERAAQLERTGGEPVLDYAGVPPYVEYAKSDVLFGLQDLRSEEPSELAFLIISQVQELLFKLLYEDLCRVRALLDADRPGMAIWALGRVRRVEEFLAESWSVVGTLSPVEFNAFRDYLGAASGFQSYMYRMVEFVLGNKVAAMARPYQDAPDIWRQVSRALNEPSMYDAAVRLLARRGAAIPDDVLNHDPARRRGPSEAVEHAWAAVYQGAAPADEMHLLAESLIAVAEGLSRWRSLHLLVVERVIGTKPGTGGTGGVSWLSRINKHRFFPELWSARRIIQALPGPPATDAGDHPGE
jgi:tryptophan 2,3-dioxygenase